MKYIVNIATAISQLINAAVFFGDPNETISGRCFREKIEWAESIINGLFFFQPDHCFYSHLADVEFSRKIMEIKND
jgi:hypothetical protein